MGCDGGTIPRRDELVKVKKKPEAKDKDAELAFKWRCCSITQQLLQSPIVMCGLGRFYNKLALIEALLNRDKLPECARHIKSLKDVKNLNFTENPAYKTDEKSAPYICPVIGLEMSGKFRFVALWTCGCVFSERALKEINTNNCHKCQKPFVEDDIVVLNPTEEDIDLMQSRLEVRQRNVKKNKEKKIKIKTEEEDPVSIATTAATLTTTAATSTTTAATSTTTAATSRTTSATSTTIINPTKNGLLKKRPAVVLGSLTESSTVGKKTKADYSVAKDPNASDVYKSLFTSHKSEQEQNRAHWITYNPFYN